MAAAAPRPRTEEELLGRARALAGARLGEVAASLRRPVPSDLRRAKGWVGELVELALGASAGSRPEPDFPELGIEVKTLPVDAQGAPKESTHVCAISMREAAGAHWETSVARAKLARVLWVPVEAAAAIALPMRHIGQAILWSPDTREEALLRRDWEEHMELIALGRSDQIRGEMGAVLQVRPKAASGGSRTPVSDGDGVRAAALPLGFYLRPRFTAAILGRVYAPLR
ncbi:MAG: DNA mismatch repair protein MutH [Gammaproteobacteria bacterium]|nr:DNA mismatch repair protein MutH [Gammaproteobacteria bacterium]